MKPNRKNRTLNPLGQDDSAITQQLWEHRLKTLGQLFNGQIDFSGISKFSNRSEEKVFIGIINLSEGLQTTQYQLTNAFSSWEVVFWDYKRQEYTIQSTRYIVITETRGTPDSYRSAAR